MSLTANPKTKSALDKVLLDNTLTPQVSRKRENPTLHVMGTGLMALAPGMLFAAAIEWGSSTSHDEWALVLSAIISFVVGVGLRTTTKIEADLQPTSVFSIVAWTWVACSVVGALPFWFGSMFGWGSFDAALFEAISGFSCSGSTVIPDIEANGRGVLMWRQLTHWYGGMGVVVLAVTVLPHLGVGGLALMTAEAPGHSSDRIAPRVSETARRLWTLYLGVTVAILLALWAMPSVNLYDAVAHASATAATGGFSTYNNSVAHFGSVWVEMILVTGMIFCGISFALHFRALREGPKTYGRSGETRWYLYLLFGGIAVITFLNQVTLDVDFGTNLRDSVFNVTTLVSSTGFANARPDGIGDFVLWAGAAQMIMLGFMVIGGCTGSTSGGSKVMRARVLAHQTVRELKRLRHPRGVFTIKMGRRDALPETIVASTLAFMAMFFFVTLFGTIAVAAMGVDLLTAASGAISSMSNMGPALGEAGPTSNFLAFPRPARMVLATLMLIGRLEIYAVLLMFASMTKSIKLRAAAAANSTGRP